MTAELSNKTIYKGQKITFLGCIQCVIASVYVQGRKVPSAFFSTDSKPVFRSESARYVLFIQMSREMWDFDSEGSGEIMFSKVVNGFLPALFRRWVTLKARHLVSIVLFTRVEYDTGITTELNVDDPVNSFYTGVMADGSRKRYKDFYRVVKHTWSLMVKHKGTSNSCLLGECSWRAHDIDDMNQHDIWRGNGENAIYG